MADRLILAFIALFMLFIAGLAVRANAMTLDEATVTPEVSCTPTPALNIEEATPGLTFDTPMPTMTEAPVPTPTAVPGSTDDHLGCGEHSCEATSNNNATTPQLAPDTGHAAL